MASRKYYSVESKERSKRYGTILTVKCFSQTKIKDVVVFESRVFPVLGFKDSSET